MKDTVIKKKTKSTPLVIRKVVPCCEPFIVTDEELNSDTPANESGIYTSITKQANGTNLVRCYVVAQIME